MSSGDDLDLDLGRAMHRWASDLFPICRSLTGRGVRETLAYLGELLPGLVIHEVPTGSEVCDWVVPDEWNVREAFVSDRDGRRVIDFDSNNLHLVGYSEPVDREVSREELDAHLYSLPEQPSAIPYVTSYYKRRWGFCITQEDRDALGDGPFRVRIDATLEPGNLTYGELIIPGRSEQEVLISTYVCHPSMANNELSGPVVATALARWLRSRDDLRYTYRIIFVPETLGSVTYLAQHLDELKARLVAGWVVTCIGDERCYSYLPSRRGGTLADRSSLAALSEIDPEFKRYTFLDRGSDERQWCSPRADLPVCSIMRSKYGEYPEYHTSLDDLDLVTPRGLSGGLAALRRAVEILESNDTWRSTVVGEPQLGPRGLYPTSSYKGSADAVRTMMNVLAYCDGETDMLEIADIIDAPFAEVEKAIATFADAELVERVEHF